MKKILSKLIPDLPDTLMVAGSGAISYGIWTIYAPAGFVMGGVFMLLAGFLSARAQGK